MARWVEGKGAHLSLDRTAEIPGSLDDVPRDARVAFHLAQDDIDALRAAIERSLCEGEIHGSSERSFDEELRKSLRVACAKARLQRVRAEHVLIDVKQIWTLIPSELATRTREKLSKIVTACIDEYYAKSERSEI